MLQILHSRRNGICRNFTLCYVHGKCIIWEGVDELICYRLGACRRPPQLHYESLSMCIETVVLRKSWRGLFVFSNITSYIVYVHAVQLLSNIDIINLHPSRLGYIDLESHQYTLIINIYSLHMYIQTAMAVLIPVKRLCNNRLQTTAATVYTKTKSTGDTTEHIDTKKNEVYGMSMQLTDNSIIKSK